MQLIDTHTHLYLPEFDNDRKDMINRAVNCGVVKLLMPNIDLHSVNLMLDAAERFKDVCYPMIGLHPTSVKTDYLIQIEELEKLALKHKFIAIGEIGIDLYWDKTYLKEQIEALRRQVAFAIKTHLPVVIHSREASGEVFSILDEFKGMGLRGVLHAFSGNIKDVRRALALEFKLGIGGPLTFKYSGLDLIVKEAGIENIILETDSPYLAPVPFRGKRNESSYINIINNKLAAILGMAEEETASVTYKNSCCLFNI